MNEATYRVRGSDAISKMVRLIQGDKYQSPEARAIGSVTAPATSPDTIQANLDGGRLYPYVTIHRVKSADIAVPRWSTALAVPSGSARGATGVSADSTAVYGGQVLICKPILSILEASRGALMTVNFEDSLRQAMQRAFFAAIDKGIVAGSGAGNDPFLGVFTASADGVPTASDVACGASGAPKLADAHDVICKVLTLGANPKTTALIVHPNFVKAWQVETTSGFDALRFELCTKGTLGGVAVVGSSYAPTTLTAGSYVGACLDLVQYSVGVAEDFVLEMIPVEGSDNGVFQGYYYAAGAPSIGSQARRLKTV